ncbi:hypothetical protein V1525DRAFT_409356 [Lipomyces kononenkoae]|uniref:Uncharacterized protein n=1 Tax=Lipomyces kononenkoae TaxID=34357 RepID=A0ACC3SWA4_LIPKO
MRLRELLKRFSGRHDAHDQFDKNFLSPNTTIIPYTSLFTEGVSDSDTDRYLSRLWDPASPTPHPGLDLYHSYYGGTHDAQLARLDMSAKTLSFVERWRTRRVRRCRRRKAKIVSETVIDISEELLHWRRRLQELIDGGWPMDSSRVDRALNELRQQSFIVRDRKKIRSRQLHNSISIYADSVDRSKFKALDDPTKDAREQKLREIGNDFSGSISSETDADPFRSDVSTSIIPVVGIQESTRNRRHTHIRQEPHESSNNSTTRASLTDLTMTNRRHEIYSLDPDPGIVTVTNIYAILHEFTRPTNSDDENEESWQFRNQLAHPRGSSCDYCAALRMKVRCMTEWTVKAEKYLVTFRDVYPRASESSITRAAVVKAANEVMSALTRHKENARLEQEIRLWNSQIRERTGGFQFEFPLTLPQRDHGGPVYRFL